MVKCERTYPAPASLAKRVSYNSPDVIKCLKEIFHGKCYICEMQDLQDGIVEHLMPHKDKDMELKFGWDNLFWSCNHCNSLKNRAEYEGNIIDCCKTDPERYVKNIYDPYSSTVSVRAKDSQQSSRMTAQLIEESFNRDNTGIRTNAMGQRMMDLREEWYRFQKILKEYRKNHSTYHKNKVAARLRRKTVFAAFKREYIRDHHSEYPDLQEFVSL